MLHDILANTTIMIVLTGALVGFAAALVGTFLVLRGASMLSDAISHSIIFGIVIVWLLSGQQSGPIQIVGAALTGILTVFLTELVFRTRLIKYDAAIGLVFPVLFSVGVLLVNIFARDVHIDQHTILLGEIAFVWLDTIDIAGYDVPNSLVWMGLVAVVNLAFVVLFYKELKLATFDPGLAAALGFAPGVLFYALLFLTSTTAVAAFDSVGAVLFIAFVIVPPSAAYLLTDRLWVMLVLAALIAVASSVSGYVLAVIWDVSVGGMMAVMTGAFFVLALLFGPRNGLIMRALRRRGETRVNEMRMLAVHLYNHEGEPDQAQENVAQALRSHLGWPDDKARRVVVAGLDEGLIARHDDLLALTDTGRSVARAILEPWRQAE